MNAFRSWYHTHQDAISWFLVGFLTMGGLNALANGNYTDALLDFGLAGLNYWFTRYRL
jgi:hypothetical protein